jgi:hypothetical protein
VIISNFFSNKELMRSRICLKKIDILMQSLLVIAVLITVRTNVSGQEPAFAGVSLSVASPTVPPGGLLQMQVFITEPKPILKGRQRTTLKTAPSAAASRGFMAEAAAAFPLGGIRDAALFSTGPDVSGVAVTTSTGTQFFFSSPLTSFGSSIDTPVMAASYPVLSTAKAGQKVGLALDPGESVWLDPNGNPYPTELKSGSMTVGGTLSVSDVVPGGGTVPAGSVISIKGVGFQPNSKVDFGEGRVISQQFINSTLIKVTLRDAIQVRGQRIRVENSGNERATYFPFQRTTKMGSSTHALIAESYPLFPKTALTVGYFRPSLHGTVFSGLALQNLNSLDQTATLQLYSKAGVLLSERMITLARNTRFVRDLVELFPGVTPADGTKLKVTSTKGIQMLGLLGDDSASTVLPVPARSTP